MLCDRTETEASTVEQYAKQNDQDAIRSEAGAGNTQSWRKEQLQKGTRATGWKRGVGTRDEEGRSGRDEERRSGRDEERAKWA
jgi:hypothetical protein